MSSLLLIASLFAPPPAAPPSVALPSAAPPAAALSAAPKSAAKPAPTMADYADQVDRCFNGAPTLGRIEDAGKNAFVWHFKAKTNGFDRVVVLKTLSEGCESVFTVGRADGRVIAPFDPKNGGMKAFVVQNQPDRECAGDDAGGCERALLLRDKNRKVLSVLPIGQCEYLVSLTAVQVLPGQPSIMVECGSSGGGDMLGHYHDLVHVIDGELTTIASASTGYSMENLGAEDPSQEKCRKGPNGYIKVLRKGAKARIEEHDPDEKLARILEWNGKTFKEVSRRKMESEPGAGPFRCKFKL